jgi:hypothetical protein
MPHSEDPGSTRHNVLVTVEERAHARLEEVAKDLRKRGLKVVDVFPLGGVIAGEAKRDGADGGTRTRTPRGAEDFKSPASTGSATSARRLHTSRQRKRESIRR